ncbi:MAG: SDR family oxidoreductase [Thiotrichales bacterium]|nr:SDR family oxidoreductase [Thiotrichales bacterium]
MNRFADKVVAVTGGASGIGEATVRRFVEEGARVAFADRDAERGTRVAAELETQGATAHFVEADVGSEAEATGFVEAAVARFGRLDVLVNNAGIRKYQAVTEASKESWDEMLAVNLLSYAICARAAIPVMTVGGGGAIVNVASIRSLIAGSECVQYDTTKAAVLGLTRSMARDHAAQGVRVNAVGPGPIFTPFHARRAEALGQGLESYIEEFGAETMLKRPGTAREIANGIAFLASDEASYITGTCLFIDGGQTAL